MVAAAIGGAALAGVAGSAISASGAQSAANTQANAANNATAEQLAMYNQTVGNEQPYMNAGSTALNTLAGQLPSLTQQYQMPGVQASINNSNWQQYMSPAYNFQLQQGQQALQNSQAAGDGVLSGAALKGLIGYNQNMAGTAFQNAFNDYQTQAGTQFNQGLSLVNANQAQNQNIYNRLAGLAQLGQNAASNQGMAGAGMASGIANTITGAGNAQAAGAVGTANAISGGLNGLGGYSMLNSLINTPQTNAYSSMFNPVYQSSYSGFDSPSNYG